MPVFDIKGKGAIVTGGGSGINLALVKALHAGGCSVLIADLSLHKTAEEWLSMIIKGQGPKIHFQKTDVTDWSQLDRAFDVFEKEIGGCPDLVVPGAGVYEPSFNGFWDDSEKNSNRYKLFEINLFHPIQMTRIAVRRMQRAGKPGVVCHVSSISAQRPSITVPLYSASKQGISQFVRSMAPLDDLGGVRVVGVAPGAIATPLFFDNPNSLALVDLDRDVLLPPEEVAKAMIAVITDPRYPPGTILEVGDIGQWREVMLFNDDGPKGRATLLRKRAADHVLQIREWLEKDRTSRTRSLL